MKIVTYFLTLSLSLLPFSGTGYAGGVLGHSRISSSLHLGRRIHAGQNSALRLGSVRLNRATIGSDLNMTSRVGINGPITLKKNGLFQAGSLNLQHATIGGNVNFHSRVDIRGSVTAEEGSEIGMAGVEITGGNTPSAAFRQSGSLPSRGYPATGLAGPVVKWNDGNSSWSDAIDRESVKVKFPRPRLKITRRRTAHKTTVTIQRKHLPKPTVKIGWSHKWLDKENSFRENDYYKFLHHQLQARSGYNYDVTKKEHELSLINLKGTFTILEGDYDKPLGPANVGVHGEFGTVEGKFTPVALTASSGKIVAKSEIGIEAVLAKEDIHGQVYITPKSIYDATVGRITDTSAPEYLGEHGLVVYGKGEAGYGAAAKAEGSIFAGSDGVGTEITAKLGAGPEAGGTLGLIIK